MFALGAKGGILEIGPYVGGSTIAIASGLRDRTPLPFASIERGGRDLAHPDYPSQDILRDLKFNLQVHKLSSYVKVIEGESGNPKVCAEVFKTFGHDGIGMLFIDADGEIGRDMDLYGSLLKPDCILVFDDYAAPGARHKELRVRSIVDKKVASGRLEPFGVFGWGTWFGRYKVNR